MSFLKNNIFPASISCFPRRLEDVFRVTVSHLSRRLQDVFKNSSRSVCKTSSKDVFKTCLQNVFFKASSGSFYDVFKEDVLQTRLENFLEDKKFCAEDFFKTNVCCVPFFQFCTCRDFKADIIPLLLVVQR